MLGAIASTKWIKAFLLQDITMPARLAPKATMQHIKPNNFQKMNVSLATQLLSGSVGASVQTYTALGVLPPEAMATGKFCEQVNNFYKRFQGKVYDPNPAPDNYKCAMTDNSPHLRFQEEKLQRRRGGEPLHL